MIQAVGVLVGKATFEANSFDQAQAWLAEPCRRSKVWGPHPRPSLGRRP